MKKFIFILSGLMVLWGIILSASAQQMPQDNWYFEQRWGGSGTNNGQFSSPYGIAIDTNGLVVTV